MPASLNLVPRSMNFLDDPIYFEIESDLMNGGSAGAWEADEENLWCYVEIESTALGSVVKTEGTFKLPYSTVNKLCQGDISGLMDIPAVTPNANTLDTSVVTSGQLDYLRQVRIKFEDAFGIPLAIPVSLEQSSDFIVIKGGSKYYQGFGDGADLGYILASRIGSNGLKYGKEVRKDQPEIINFFVHDSKTITVDVVFYYKDLSDELASAVTSFAALGDHINYFTAGWNQLGLDGHVNPAKELSYYKVVLSGVGTENSLYYHLDDRDLDQDLYLAYENGMGGIEIARFSGYHQKTIQAKGERVNKARTSNVNFQKGLISKTNARGSYSTKYVSGYYSKYYIEELAQCLLGEAWICDPVRQKYYKIYVNPTDVVIIDEDEDHHYLEITVIEHDRSTHHNFRY